MPAFHVGWRRLEVRSLRALNAMLSSRSDLTGSREPARFESSPETLHVGKLRWVGWTGDREGKTKCLLVAVVLMNGG